MKPFTSYFLPLSPVKGKTFLHSCSPGENNKKPTAEIAEHAEAIMPKA
jgi:hypothetical protein